MNNKCMPICFWCTKETGKYVTLKQIDDNPVPKKAILNYEPCDNCKELFSKGIHIIGVSEKQIVEDMMPIAKDNDVSLYPTGSFFVANQEWVEQMLKANNREDILEYTLEKKVLMIPEEIISKIIEESKDVPEVEFNTDFMEEKDESNSN